jgi:hypothetical protein
LVYLDARHWNRERQRGAEELQKVTGLLTNLTKIKFHDEEYPTKADETKVARATKASNKSKRRAEMKARRNKWK